MVGFEVLFSIEPPEADFGKMKGKARPLASGDRSSRTQADAPVVTCV